MNYQQGREIHCALGVRANGFELRFYHRDDGGQAAGDRELAYRFMIRPQDQIRFAFDTVEGNPNARYVSGNRSFEGEDLLLHPLTTLRVVVLEPSENQVVTITILLNDRAFSYPLALRINNAGNEAQNVNERHETNYNFFGSVNTKILSISGSISGFPVDDVAMGARSDSAVLQ